MGDIARYFHSSLYAFDEEARAAVLNKFRSECPNVAVTCLYDSERHEFRLECPTFVGAEADDALYRAISTYIRTELHSAEQEDRDPSIQRFVESKFDSIDAIDEEEEEETTDNLQSNAARRLQATHLIFGTGSKVQLFNMFRLPNGLLERALAPRHPHAERMFTAGMTCRTVREERNGGYVFNSRTGSREAVPDCNEIELGLIGFGLLEDQREEPKGVKDVQPKTWEHVGRPPTVEQWIRGMGQVRQVGVDEKPDLEELPKDARKHLAEGISHGAGRVRMPKGAQLVPDDEVTTTRQESAPVSKPHMSFGDLLGQRTSAGDDDSESSSARSSRSGDSEQAQSQTFQDLRGTPVKGPERHPSGDWTTILPQSRVSANVSPVRPASASISRTRNETLSSAKDAASPINHDPREKEEFPSYGPSFARVDDIGLTANPSDTAQWHERYRNQKDARAKTGPVASRPPRSRQTSEKSESAVQSPPSTSVRSRVLTPRSSKTSAQASSKSQVARTYTPDEAPNGEWVNKVVPAQMSQGGLVDARAQYSSRPVPVPPGMRPERAVRVPPHENAPTPASEHSVNLIEDSENVLEAPEVRPSQLRLQRNYRQALIPTPASAQRSNLPAHDDDDEIVERLSVMPPDFATKHYTMRQKAGKKVKSKSQSKATGKSAAAKVSLPLPSPPPPPRPKKEEPPAPLNGLQRERRKPPGQAQLGSSREEVAHPRSLADPGHDFGRQLLQSLASADTQKRTDDEEEDDDEDFVDTLKPQLQLVAQLGLLLTWRTDQYFANGVYDTGALQAKFNNVQAPIGTEFVPRLTTAAGDAKYLIKIGGRADQAVTDTSYEIYLRDIAGSSLRLTLPLSADGHFSLTSANTVVNQACAHFPGHVWDARFLLLQPGTASATSASEAVAEFVASMHTSGTPPSFKAQVRSAAFTVDRVLAKQTVWQDHDGLVFRVTKVQDLFLESLDDVRHNFLAVASQHDEMIDYQRMWWEASWETFDLSRAEEMQARVVEMVSNMDGVGLNNNGPFMHSEVADESDGVEAAAPAIDPSGVTWYW